LLKDLIISIQAYFQAHAFIRKHKLWRWIIIPGIIYACVFVIGMYFFGQTANHFMEWLKSLIQDSLTKINSSFLSFLITIGSFMIWIMMMLFYFSLFKYFFLIVGSPVFAYLSEKTESIIEGKSFTFSLPQLLKDILRGIKLSLRNSLWQTVYYIFLFLVSSLPVIGWFLFLLTLLIECYYYGFSMLDYSMERHKKSAAESIYFIGNHKGLAIGNGMIFYLMHLVPVIGWIFAPAYAVIAATLCLQPMKEQQEFDKL